MKRLQLANEWRVLRRHPLLWLALTGVCGFGAALTLGSPPPAGSDAQEALLRLNLFVPAFILPFLAGALGPLFFLREAEHDMREIFGSYPLTVRRGLVMRLGSFMLLLLAGCLLAQIVIVGLLTPNYPNSLFDLVIQSAGWLLLIHAPSCLVWACLLARLSSATGHSGFLYLAAGIGWLLYIALGSLTGTPLLAGSIVISAQLTQVLLVLDPYAITALANPVPQNGILQSRELNLAAGRLVWLLVCLLLVLGIKELPIRRVRSVGVESEGKTLHNKMLETKSQKLPEWLGHVSLHVRYFARDKVFPLLVGAWVLLLGPEVYSGLGYLEPLARVAADSRDALNRVVWDVLPMTGALLILYAADRICRMYSTVRMHELVAASHRSSALVIHQVISLWFIAAMFVALAGLAVLRAQVAARSPIQTLEYLLQLGPSFLQLALFAMLFAAVHGLVRFQLVANLLNFSLIVLCFSSLASILGLHHPLWRPLSTPLMNPDHYWAFQARRRGQI